jgi:hypothetical protein
MIWLVMAWRMSFWFGMADSKVIVGYQRLNRWCQSVAKEPRKRDETRGSEIVRWWRNLRPRMNLEPGDTLQVSNIVSLMNAPAGGRRFSPYI